MLELVGEGSVINGPTLSIKKNMVLLSITIFKIMNEGLFNHPNIVQVFTVIVNELDSYALANKPIVHSG